MPREKRIFPAPKKKKRTAKQRKRYSEIKKAWYAEDPNRAKMIGQKTAATKRENALKEYREETLAKEKMTNQYSNYRNPEECKPLGDVPNPYDYNMDREQKKEEPKDVTPANDEFRGAVDLFDSRLFPAQNSKKYSTKSGREFLGDFTAATRGQLVVCMSRLAQDNPKEFAKIWIEMEKFNTPQQASIDLNAQLSAKASLYDTLDAKCVEDAPQDPFSAAEEIVYEAADGYEEDNTTTQDNDNGSEEEQHAD